jgi:Flp pilus assembly protein TadD
VFKNGCSCSCSTARIEFSGGTGITYSTNGQLDWAITDFTESIRLNPKDAKAYYNRGVIYGKKGEPDKAEADYAKAKELGYEPQ